MAASTFATRTYRFYTRLAAPAMPAGVTVMNPYVRAEVRRCVRAFLDRYFADGAPRLLVFGINPGRFGAGLTGVTFTDPVALADECGIPNDMPRRRELSSEFIYQVIGRTGGPRRFYARIFLTAASPLGFTRDGRNLNYYDTPELARATTPFIIRTIEQQLAVGGRRDRAVVLGRGDNLRFMTRLNEEHGWFERLDALDHPRFIMQYRRLRLAEYLGQYARLLRG